MPNFYEFFAGGGMARAGLGENWSCQFANDFDAKKAFSYAENWGKDHLRIGDIAGVELSELHGRADLAWASFPCQDLSHAGSRAGLQGERSGTFWSFWKLVRGLALAKREPKIITLENVYGLISSTEGKDFAALGKAFTELGYRFGAVVIDAVHFVPQSRPRLFVIAIAKDVVLPPHLVRGDPTALWHPRKLVDAKANLPLPAQDNWIWWNIPAPATRELGFADLIEAHPMGVQGNSAQETQSLLDMMSPLTQAKVSAAKKSGKRHAGALYRRTSYGIQRAEVRFDDVAGCLRTPGGGSSRQSILVVEGNKIRSRLLSPREAARLMGLPDEYLLPEKYNDAYRLMGDGLVVPVISHIEEHILAPILLEAQSAGYTNAA